jgi:hypothetical protein
MARPTLLLDIDNVLIRDPTLLGHVKHNVVHYVQQKLPRCKDPERVNQLLYRTYGHTARGLESSFRIDASDFDREVYSLKLIKHLWEHLDSPEFQKDAGHVSDLCESGWDVILFSNAPLTWSGPVMRAISDKVRVSDGRYLKPEAKAYTAFPSDKHYIFVDDALTNLMTPKHLYNWTPIHFAEEPTQTMFPTLSSIEGVKTYCQITQDLARLNRL